MRACFVRPAAVVLLFVAAACTPPHAEGFLLVAPAPPPRPADTPVRLFPIGHAPECPVEELGYVHAWGNDYPLWSDSTAEASRRRVRKMGGDAVVGLEAQSQRTGTSVTRDVKRDSTPAMHQTSLQTSVTVEELGVSWLRGTVVRFTDPQCRH